MIDEEFGVTEWGADWVRAAQSKISANKRLPKARSLARNDKAQIESVTGSPIGAVVDGEQVTIALPAYTAAQLKRVERLLATDQDASSHAPGDLSESAHLALTNAGLDPVPGAIDAECTCGAKAQPCVHILAVYYELSRRLDEQPQLALVLRGRASTEAAAAGEITQRWIPLEELDASQYYRPGTS